MKHTSFFLILIGLLLIACGDPAKKGALKTIKESIELSINDILDASKVHLFLKSNPKQTKESNDLFMRGIDAYKNKQLLDSAKYYLEHSIQQQPTSIAYYELGNIYRELKSYDNSLLSYKLAEKLGFAPFSNLLYQISGTYSLQENEVMAAKYLEYALQAGFTDIEKINKDKNLDYLKSRNYHFTEAMQNGMKGMSNPETLFWLQFKRQFSPITFPKTINSEFDSEAFNAMGYISYDFERFIPQMRNSKFSREVGESYYYGYNLGENEVFTTLMYIKSDHYLGEYDPKIFVLSTFDSKGNLIDKIEIGQMEELSDIATILSLKSSTDILAKIYKLEYEKDPMEEGYWENSIKKRTYTTAFRYQIDAKGKISVTEESEKVS